MSRRPIGTAMLCSLLGALSLGASGPDAAPVPVLVELYTSEGCSSCPPADALLAELLRTQPVRGARIVALEQHVDYWNRLGWRDPFSSPAGTARQREYAERFRNETIYTPQMIVDGAEEFVGGDRERAIAAVERAARSAKAALALEIRGVDNEPTIAMTVAIADPRSAAVRAPCDVLLAVVERDLASDVLRGENAGRRLGHAAVVRELRRIGGIDGNAVAPLELAASVDLAPEWRREKLGFVAFVQERGGRRVVGVASAELPR